MVSNTVRLNHIPGPTGASLSRLHAFHQNPLTLFEKLSHEYGHRVQFRMGPWTFLLLSDPESVGLILSHHRPAFHKGPGLDPKNPLIGQGLLTSEEEDWVEQRRSLAPVFRTANIRSTIPELTTAVERLTAQLPEDTAFDLQPAMLRLSLTLIMETLFATDQLNPHQLTTMSSDIEWLMAHFYHRSRSVWRFPYNVPIFNRRYHTRANRLNRTIDSLVPTNRPYEVIWPHLSQSRPKWYHEALTLIIAGHETTGHAMAWSLDLMSRHPVIEEAVLNESHQEMTPTPDTHPWTYAIFRESLRLYPPVWILSRVTHEEFPLGKTKIPKGTFILVSPWLIHRNPAYFTKPDQFYPERWFNNPIIPPYGYIPFGAGPRACIGEHLATTEALIAISAMVRTYRLTTHGPRDVFPGITLAAAEPMWTILKKR